MANYLPYLCVVLCLVVASNAYCFRSRGMTDAVKDTCNECTLDFGSGVYNCCRKGSALTPVYDDTNCEATFDQDSCEWNIHKKPNSVDPNADCKLLASMGK